MAKRRKEYNDEVELSFDEDPEKSRQQDRWNRRKQKRRDFDDEEWDDDDN